MYRFRFRRSIWTVRTRAILEEGIYRKGDLATPSTTGGNLDDGKAGRPTLHRTNFSCANTVASRRCGEGRKATPDLIYPISNLQSVACGLLWPAEWLRE